MKHLFIATIFAVMLSGPASAEDLAGYDKFPVEASHRTAPVPGSLWYPVGTKTYKGMIGDNAVFQGTRAYVGAAIAEGRHPLVLLSHGSGGNMDNLGWLSAGLALKGAMVLAVNHPGSTTGDSSPRRSIRIWERPADLSAALDHVLADPAIAPFVDTDRIYSIGFSLGGLTALQLVGLQPDRQLFEDYCARMGNEAQDCFFFSKGGVDFSRLPEEKFNSSQVDPRVVGSAVIDPAMSYAFSPESIVATELPVQLINFGGPDDRWKAVDVGPDGSGLAAGLPRADYVEISPANHFTFLAVCKDAAGALLIEEGEDPICDDPEGADRGSVHNRVLSAIIGFLDLRS